MKFLLWPLSLLKSFRKSNGDRRQKSKMDTSGKADDSPQKRASEKITVISREATKRVEPEDSCCSLELNGAKSNGNVTHRKTSPGRQDERFDDSYNARTDLYARSRHDSYSTLKQSYSGDYGNSDYGSYYSDYTKATVNRSRKEESSENDHTGDYLSYYGGDCETRQGQHDGAAREFYQTSDNYSYYGNTFLDNETEQGCQEGQHRSDNNIEEGDSYENLYTGTEESQRRARSFKTDDYGSYYTDYTGTMITQKGQEGAIGDSYETNDYGSYFGEYTGTNNTQERQEGATGESYKTDDYGSYYSDYTRTMDTQERQERATGDSYKTDGYGSYYSDYTKTMDTQERQEGAIGDSYKTDDNGSYYSENTATMYTLEGQESPIEDSYETEDYCLYHSGYTETKDTQGEQENPTSDSYKSDDYDPCCYYTETKQEGQESSSVESYKTDNCGPYYSDYTGTKNTQEGHEGRNGDIYKKDYFSSYYSDYNETKNTQKEQETPTGDSYITDDYGSYYNDYTRTKNRQDSPTGYSDKTDDYGSYYDDYTETRSTQGKQKMTSGVSVTTFNNGSFYSKYTRTGDEKKWNQICRTRNVNKIDDFDYTEPKYTTQFTRGSGCGDNADKKGFLPSLPGQREIQNAPTSSLDPFAKDAMSEVVVASVSSSEPGTNVHPDWDGLASNCYSDNVSRDCWFYGWFDKKSNPWHCYLDDIRNVMFNMSEEISTEKDIQTAIDAIVPSSSGFSITESPSFVYDTMNKFYLKDVWDEKSKSPKRPSKKPYEEHESATETLIGEEVFGEIYQSLQRPSYASSRSGVFKKENLWGSQWEGSSVSFSRKSYPAEDIYKEYKRTLEKIPETVHDKNVRDEMTKCAHQPSLASSRSVIGKRGTKVKKRASENSVLSFSQKVYHAEEMHRKHERKLATESITRDDVMTERSRSPEQTYAVSRQSTVRKKDDGKVERGLGSDSLSLSQRLGGDSVLFSPKSSQMSEKYKECGEKPGTLTDTVTESYYRSVYDSYYTGSTEYSTKPDFVYEEYVEEIPSCYVYESDYAPYNVETILKTRGSFSKNKQAKGQLSGADKLTDLGESNFETYGKSYTSYIQQFESQESPQYIGSGLKVRSFKKVRRPDAQLGENVRYVPERTDSSEPLQSEAYKRIKPVFVDVTGELERIDSRTPQRKADINEIKKKYQREIMGEKQEELKTTSAMIIGKAPDREYISHDDSSSRFQKHKILYGGTKKLQFASQMEKPRNSEIIETLNDDITKESLAATIFRTPAELPESLGVQQVYHVKPTKLSALDRWEILRNVRRISTLWAAQQIGPDSSYTYLYVKGKKHPSDDDFSSISIPQDVTSDSELCSFKYVSYDWQHNRVDDIFSLKHTHDFDDNKKDGETSLSTERKYYSSENTTNSVQYMIVDGISPINHGHDFDKIETTAEPTETQYYSSEYDYTSYDKVHRTLDDIFSIKYTPDMEKNEARDKKSEPTETQHYSDYDYISYDVSHKTDDNISSIKHTYDFEKCETRDKTSDSTATRYYYSEYDYTSYDEKSYKKVDDIFSIKYTPDVEKNKTRDKTSELTETQHYSPDYDYSSYDGTHKIVNISSIKHTYDFEKSETRDKTSESTDTQYYSSEYDYMSYDKPHKTLDEISSIMHKRDFEEGELGDKTLEQRHGTEYYSPEYDYTSYDGPHKTVEDIYSIKYTSDLEKSETGYETSKPTETQYYSSEYELSSFNADDDSSSIKYTPAPDFETSQKSDKASEKPGTPYYSSDYDYISYEGPYGTDDEMKCVDPRRQICQSPHRQSLVPSHSAISKMDDEMVRESEEVVSVLLSRQSYYTPEKYKGQDEKRRGSTEAVTGEDVSRKMCESPLASIHTSGNQENREMEKVKLEDISVSLGDNFYQSTEKYQEYKDQHATLMETVTGEYLTESYYKTVYDSFYTRATEYSAKPDFVYEDYIEEIPSCYVYVSDYVPFELVNISEACNSSEKRKRLVVPQSEIDELTEMSDKLTDTSDTRAVTDGELYTEYMKQLGSQGSPQYRPSTDPYRKNILSFKSIKRPDAKFGNDKRYVGYKPDEVEAFRSKIYEKVPTISMDDGCKESQSIRSKTRHQEDNIKESKKVEKEHYKEITEGKQEKSQTPSDIKRKACVRKYISQNDVNAGVKKRGIYKKRLKSLSFAAQVEKISNSEAREPFDDDMDESTIKESFVANIIRTPPELPDHLGLQQVYDIKPTKLTAKDHWEILRNVRRISTLWAAQQIGPDSSYTYLYVKDSNDSSDDEYPFKAAATQDVTSDSEYGFYKYEYTSNESQYSDETSSPMYTYEYEDEIGDNTTGATGTQDYSFVYEYIDYDGQYNTIDGISSLKDTHDFAKNETLYETFEPTATIDKISESPETQYFSTKYDYTSYDDKPHKKVDEIFSIKYTPDMEENETRDKTSEPSETQRYSDYDYSSYDAPHKKDDKISLIKHTYDFERSETKGKTYDSTDTQYYSEYDYTSYDDKSYKKVDDIFSIKYTPDMEKNEARDKKSELTETQHYSDDDYSSYDGPHKKDDNISSIKHTYDFEKSETRDKTYDSTDTRYYSEYDYTSYDDKLQKTLYETFEPTASQYYTFENDLTSYEWQYSIVKEVSSLKSSDDVDKKEAVDKTTESAMTAYYTSEYDNISYDSKSKAVDELSSVNHVGDGTSEPTSTEYYDSENNYSSYLSRYSTLFNAVKDAKTTRDTDSIKYHEGSKSNGTLYYHDDNYIHNYEGSRSGGVTFEPIEADNYYYEYNYASNDDEYNRLDEKYSILERDYSDQKKKKYKDSFDTVTTTYDSSIYDYSSYDSKYNELDRMSVLENSGYYRKRKLGKETSATAGTKHYSKYDSATYRSQYEKLDNISGKQDTKYFDKKATSVKSSESTVTRFYSSTDDYMLDGSQYKKINVQDSEYFSKEEKVNESSSRAYYSEYESLDQEERTRRKPPMIKKIINYGVQGHLRSEIYNTDFITSRSTTDQYPSIIKSGRPKKNLERFARPTYVGPARRFSSYECISLDTITRSDQFKMFRDTAGDGEYYKRKKRTSISQNVPTSESYQETSGYSGETQGTFDIRISTIKSPRATYEYEKDFDTYIESYETSGTKYYSSEYDQATRDSLYYKLDGISSTQDTEDLDKNTKGEKQSEFTGTTFYSSEYDYTSYDSQNDKIAEISSQQERQDFDKKGISHDASESSSMTYYCTKYESESEPERTGKKPPVIKKIINYGVQGRFCNDIYNTDFVTSTSTTNQYPSITIVGKSKKDLEQIARPPDRNQTRRFSSYECISSDTVTGSDQCKMFRDTAGDGEYHKRTKGTSILPTVSTTEGFRETSGYSGETQGTFDIRISTGKSLSATYEHEKDFDTYIESYETSGTKYYSSEYDQATRDSLYYKLDGISSTQDTEDLDKNTKGEKPSKFTGTTFYSSEYDYTSYDSKSNRIAEMSSQQERQDFDKKGISHDTSESSSMTYYCTKYESESEPERTGRKPPVIKKIINYGRKGHLPSDIHNTDFVTSSSTTDQYPSITIAGKSKNLERIASPSHRDQTRRFSSYEYISLGTVTQSDQFKMFHDTGDDAEHYKRTKGTSILPTVPTSEGFRETSGYSGETQGTSDIRISTTKTPSATYKHEKDFDTDIENYETLGTKYYPSEYDHATRDSLYYKLDGISSTQDTENLDKNTKGEKTSEFAGTTFYSPEYDYTSYDSQNDKIAEISSQQYGQDLDKGGISHDTSESSSMTYYCTQYESESEPERTRRKPPVIKKIVNYGVHGRLRSEIYNTDFITSTSSTNQYPSIVITEKPKNNLERFARPPDRNQTRRFSSYECISSDTVTGSDQCKMFQDTAGDGEHYKRTKGTSISSNVPTSEGFQETSGYSDQYESGRDPERTGRKAPVIKKIINYGVNGHLRSDIYNTDFVTSRSTTDQYPSITIARKSENLKRIARLSDRDQTRPFSSYEFISLDTVTRSDQFKMFRDTAGVGEYYKRRKGTSISPTVRASKSFQETPENNGEAQGTFEFRKSTRKPLCAGYEYEKDFDTYIDSYETSGTKYYSSEYDHATRDSLYYKLDGISSTQDTENLDKNTKGEKTSEFAGTTFYSPEYDYTSYDSQNDKIAEISSQQDRQDFDKKGKSYTTSESSSMKYYCSKYEGASEPKRIGRKPPVIKKIINSEGKDHLRSDIYNTDFVTSSSTTNQYPSITIAGKSKNLEQIARPSHRDQTRPFSSYEFISLDTITRSDQFKMFRDTAGVGEYYKRRKGTSTSPKVRTSKSFQETPENNGETQGTFEFRRSTRKTDSAGYEHEKDFDTGIEGYGTSERTGTKCYSSEYDRTTHDRQYNEVGGISSVKDKDFYNMTNSGKFSETTATKHYFSEYDYTAYDSENFDRKRKGDEADEANESSSMAYSKFDRLDKQEMIERKPHVIKKIMNIEVQGHLSSDIYKSDFGTTNSTTEQYPSETTGTPYYSPEYYYTLYHRQCNKLGEMSSLQDSEDIDKNKNRHEKNDLTRMTYYSSKYEGAGESEQTRRKPPVTKKIANYLVQDHLRSDIYNNDFVSSPIATEQYPSITVAGTSKNVERITRLAKQDKNSRILSSAFLSYDTITRANQCRMFQITDDNTESTHSEYDYEKLDELSPLQHTGCFWKKADETSGSSGVKYYSQCKGLCKQDVKRKTKLSEKEIVSSIGTLSFDTITRSDQCNLLQTIDDGRCEDASLMTNYADYTGILPVVSESISKTRRFSDDPYTQRKSYRIKEPEIHQEFQREQESTLKCYTNDAKFETPLDTHKQSSTIEVTQKSVNTEILTSSVCDLESISLSSYKDLHINDDTRGSEVETPHQKTLSPKDEYVHSNYAYHTEFNTTIKTESESILCSEINYGDYYKRSYGITPLTQKQIEKRAAKDTKNKNSVTKSSFLSKTYEERYAEIISDLKLQQGDFARKDINKTTSNNEALYTEYYKSRCGIQQCSETGQKESTIIGGEIHSVTPTVTEEINKETTRPVVYDCRTIAKEQKPPIAREDDEYSYLKLKQDFDRLYTCGSSGQRGGDKYSGDLCKDSGKRKTPIIAKIGGDERHEQFDDGNHFQSTSRIVTRSTGSISTPSIERGTEGAARTAAATDIYDSMSESTRGRNSNLAHPSEGRGKLDTPILVKVGGEESHKQFDQRGTYNSENTSRNRISRSLPSIARRTGRSQQMIQKTVAFPDVYRTTTIDIQETRKIEKVEDKDPYPTAKTNYIDEISSDNLNKSVTTIGSSDVGHAAGLNKNRDKRKAPVLVQVGGEECQKQVEEESSYDFDRTFRSKTSSTRSRSTPRKERVTRHPTKEINERFTGRPPHKMNRRIVAVPGVPHTTTPNKEQSPSITKVEEKYSHPIQKPDDIEKRSSGNLYTSVTGMTRSDDRLTADPRNHRGKQKAPVLVKVGGEKDVKQFDVKGSYDFKSRSRCKTEFPTPRSAPSKEYAAGRPPSEIDKKIVAAPDVRHTTSTDKEAFAQEDKCPCLSLKRHVIDKPSYDNLYTPVTGISSSDVRYAANPDMHRGKQKAHLLVNVGGQKSKKQFEDESSYHYDSTYRSVIRSNKSRRIYSKGRVTRRPPYKNIERIVAAPDISHTTSTEKEQSATIWKSEGEYQYLTARQGYIEKPSYTLHTPVSGISSNDDKQTAGPYRNRGNQKAPGLVKVGDDKSVTHVEVESSYDFVSTPRNKTWSHTSRSTPCNKGVAGHPRTKINERIVAAPVVCLTTSTGKEQSLTLGKDGGKCLYPTPKPDYIDDSPYDDLCKSYKLVSGNTRSYNRYVADPNNHRGQQKAPVLVRVDGKESKKQFEDKTSYDLDSISRNQTPSIKSRSTSSEERVIELPPHKMIGRIVAAPRVSRTSTSKEQSPTIAKVEGKYLYPTLNPDFIDKPSYTDVFTSVSGISRSDYRYIADPNKHRGKQKAPVLVKVIGKERLKQV